MHWKCATMGRKYAALCKIKRPQPTHGEMSTMFVWVCDIHLGPVLLKVELPEYIDKDYMIGLGNFYRRAWRGEIVKSFKI